MRGIDGDRGVAQESALADRSFWKGYLKLSLVTCPVAMSPATTASEKLRFHTVNRKTGNRVESRYVDAETGKPVADDDQARGYAQAEDKFVILEDDELEDVALDTTRTIDIDRFVARRTIPWIYLDKPHFLVPNDPVGEEAFVVIREAMATSKVVGISRLVLYRRERAVMLEPRARGSSSGPCATATRCAARTPISRGSATESRRPRRSPMRRPSSTSGRASGARSSCRIPSRTSC